MKGYERDSNIIEWLAVDIDEANDLILYLNTVLLSFKYFHIYHRPKEDIRGLELCYIDQIFESQHFSPVSNAF